MIVLPVPQAACPGIEKLPLAEANSEKNKKQIKKLHIFIVTFSPETKTPSFSRGGLSLNLIA
jgi:hypothetical protein